MTATTNRQKKALKRIASEKYDYIIGIDEVGMGCWAGPIVVAGVVFEKKWKNPKVKDSKTLTHKKRMEVWEKIIDPESEDVCVLSQTAMYIDRMGVEHVRKELTEGIVLYLRHRFPDSIVVQDGLDPVPAYGERRMLALPKADALVPAVSAASIVAKISRDLHMHWQAQRYPQYGFSTNVGYHSQKHVSGLERHGPCPLHRRSYKPLRRYC